MSEVINLNDTSPAAPSGSVNVKWQKGASTGTDPTTGLPVYPVSANVLQTLVIGFIINSGVIGVNVGPMLAAPRAGTIGKCVVAVKASDGATALTFTIKQNGTAIFTANPTVAAGTAAGTVLTFTALTGSPLSVAAGDVFSIDITSGADAWKFSAQLES